MTMAKVLLLEDNELIRNAVQEYFEINGFEVIGLATIQDAREVLKQHRPDATILDIMLPDGSGLHLAKEIRREHDFPILFLTAKEEESDRILGFEVGGDDYVVKPFSTKELLLRVKALLRRSTPSNGVEQQQISRWMLKGRTLEVDQKAHKVYRDGEELHLTSSEWSLLTYLVQRPDQAVSRSSLLGECLGYLYSGSERTVDTHIANLRNRLGDGDWIETIRGFGYRFFGEQAEDQSPAG